MNETNDVYTSTDMAQDNIVKTKNNNFKFIIIAVVAILVILGGGFYYYFSSPKRIVTSVINSAYNGIHNILDKADDYDIEEESLLLNGNLSINTNIKGLEILNKEKVGYTIGLDYKNQKLEAGASITEDKTKLIDALVYFVDNKAYLSLKDDYKKLIEIDTDDTDFNEIFKIEKSDVSIEDLDYIAKEFKNMIIKSIDMDKLVKTSDKIKLDGKTQSVNKISYNLNEKNTKALIDALADNMLDNKDLLKKLSDISNTDIEDIKDSIKDMKDEDGEDIGKVNIYTKGLTNKVVKVELKADKNNYLAATMNNDKTEILFSSDDASFKIEVNEYTDESLDIDFTVKSDNDTVSGKIKNTAKKDGKKTKGNFEFSIKIDDNKVTVKSNYDMTIGGKIASINTKDAVNMNDMTTTDINNLTNKITNRLQKSKIFSYITTLYTSSKVTDKNNSYDYDDNDDYVDYSDYEDTDYDYNW